MTTEIDDLKRLIEEENPIAFVGAGVSVRAKYPTWGALLDNLITEAGRKKDELQLVQDDVLWRAEEIRSLFPSDDEYRAALRRIFTSTEHPIDDCIRDLVSLPFRHFMTTNYDDLLERAHEECFGAKPQWIEWGRPSAVREFITSVARKPLSIPVERRYVHIHGHLDDGPSIVLSDRDYTARYLATDEAQRKLFAIFATQVVVFFGFSLSDPDFMEILRVVRHSLGGESGRHFAVLPIRNRAEEASMRRRLAQKFDIRAVFYDQTDDHRGLEDVIRTLRGRETPPRAEPPILMRHVAADMEPAKFFASLFEQTLGAPIEPVLDTRGRTERILLLTSAAALEDEAFRRDAEEALSRTESAGAAFLTPVALDDALTKASPLTDRLRAHGWIEAERMLEDRESIDRAIHAFDAADPNKHQFGGRPIRNGRELSATVTPVDSAGTWFRVVLRVAPAAENVTFHLHPTFPQTTVEVTPANGVAELERIAWGAFTVGATTDGGRTQLELDLAEFDGAPEPFRAR